jgi:3-hydroxybutyrate dehydrogenase
MDWSLPPFKAAYVAANTVCRLTKVTRAETAEDASPARDLSGLRLYAAGRGRLIDSQARAHWHFRESVIPRRVAGAAASKHFASVEELGALTVFLAPTRRRDHRDCADGRRRWSAH